jgi:hypothetical protein
LLTISPARSRNRSLYTGKEVLRRPSILRLDQRSLARALILALGGFVLSLRLAGFPAPDSPHPSRWQAAVIPLVAWAMIETARCLKSRWSLYHAGVMILLYSELMILVMVLFLWVYL